MKLREIILGLEQWAPINYQESYDNSGLIVGAGDEDISAAIISLDCTEEVVQEAIDKNANLIISHHPIVFKGLKRFNGKNYVERTIVKAIKNNICLYAIHTNLDNVENGVNKEISDRLGLRNTRILAPKSGLLKKLVFFCPISSSDRVKSAVFMAGAGKLGNYSECSFENNGIGNFTPLDQSNPVIGEKHVPETVEETRVEVLVENRLVKKVLQALFSAHPYEEVAYDLFSVENEQQSIGSGMIGDLEVEMELEELLPRVKEKLNVSCIKYTGETKKVKRIAVCGGAGGFLLGAAKGAGADVFITSDYKYHEFFDAENDITIMDVGHYESEQFTMDLIKRFLNDKFPKFAAHLTEHNTNPVKYF